jgi:hypothetical protein
MKFAMIALLVLAMVAVAGAGTKDTGIKEEVHSTRGLLDCSNAIPITCGTEIDGDNTALVNVVSSYSCVGWNESGAETVYALTIPAPDGQTVTASLSNMSADFDVFILGSCDEADCMTSGDVSATSPCLEPGLYYVVVDGYSGATGTFTLTISCEQCECPVPPCCPFPHTCYEQDYNLDLGNTVFMDCGLGPNPWAWGQDNLIPQVACDEVPVTAILGTTLNANYPPSVGGIAMIGPYEIEEHCSCLELCHFYNTESGYDGGNVKVSTDAGATWQIVYPADGYDDILDSSFSTAECVYGEEVFTGSSVTFVKDCFDLSPYMGRQVWIGFCFGSDSSVCYLGWYIKWAKIGGTEFSAIENSTWGSIKSMYR